MKKVRALVVLSGGVDSAVAAAILVEKGYEVIGVTMRLWAEERAGVFRGQRQCCSVEDTDDARRVAQILGIRHYVLNFEEPFKKHVVEPFVNGYVAGETPNPCVRCNEKIKYRALFARLDAYGADILATGHYARVVSDQYSKNFSLLRAVDQSKDQSYVLYMLKQEQLARLELPIGDLGKDEVRSIASSLDLPVADKPDSVEICFVPNNDYRNFVAERIELIPGELKNQEGKIVGEHKGVPAYTIGQRKGLGDGFSERRYVTSLDAKNNVVTIGDEDDLYSNFVEVDGVSWISGRPPGFGTLLQAKARYGSEPEDAVVENINNSCATIRFKERQRALTPGQAIAFYDNDLVLGGGTIQKASKA